MTTSQPTDDAAAQYDVARARNAEVYPNPHEGHLRAFADETSGRVIAGSDTVDGAGARYSEAHTEAEAANTRLAFAGAQLVGAMATVDGTLRDLAEAAGLSVAVVARVLHGDKVTVLSQPGCVQCDATARALTKRGIDFIKVDVSGNAEAVELARGLGYLQVPVVVTPDGDHWSGFRPDRIADLPTDPEPPPAPAAVGPGM